MKIFPSATSVRSSLLDIDEANILIGLLSDSNASIRRSTLNSLTHLPLPQQVWEVVSNALLNELRDSTALELRAELLEIGTWIPEAFDFDKVADTIETESAIQRELKEKVKRIRSEYPVRGPEDYDESWMLSQTPGFVLYTDAESDALRVQYWSQATVVAKQLAEQFPGEASANAATDNPVVVTLLFERVYSGDDFINILLTNQLLSFLETQDSFRPDLNGLFAIYRRCLGDWISARQVTSLESWLLIGRDDEDPISWISWQIAWTVSRGGLHGLITALADHLHAEDSIERIAALGLITDCADYVLHRSAMCAWFGGGIRPPRLDPKYLSAIYYREESLPHPPQEESDECVTGSPKIIEFPESFSSITIEQPASAPEWISYENSHPARQVRELTTAYPKRLSKGEDSLFIVSIHLVHERKRALQQALNILHSDTEQAEIGLTSTEQLAISGTVVVKLSSQDIDFDPAEGITIDLQRIIEFKNIPFTAKPKENCRPGGRLVRVSAVEKTSGEEILSSAFRVNIDDYAFDHVSRPMLATLTALVSGIASAASYALGFLEQIDKTAGVAAGTTLIILAGTLGLGSRLVYGKPTVTSSITN